MTRRPVRVLSEPPRHLELLQRGHRVLADISSSLSIHLIYVPVIHRKRAGKLDRDAYSTVSHT